MAEQSNNEGRGFVVVTGASTGIGRSTVEHLARMGFDVFAGVRREQDAQDLRDLGSSNLMPITLDVTEQSSVERAAAEVTEQIGEQGLAGLVNNAGVSMSGPLEFIDPEELRQCFEVNVFGPVRVTRAFLPLLRRSQGRVVNMSSGAGRVAAPLVGPYCASKFALEALSDAWRMELHRSGIQVSLIEPGVVETPLLPKGNEGIEHAKAALPSNAPAYYREAMSKLRDQFDSSEGHRIAPETVAAVVLRALTERRPRHRYVVGGDANMLVALDRVLPQPVMDSVFRRMFGL